MKWISLWKNLIWYQRKITVPEKGIDSSLELSGCRYASEGIREATETQSTETMALRSLPACLHINAASDLLILKTFVSLNFNASLSKPLKPLKTLGVPHSNLPVQTHIGLLCRWVSALMNCWQCLPSSASCFPTLSPCMHTHTHCSSVSVVMYLPASPFQTVTKLPWPDKSCLV